MPMSKEVEQGLVAGIFGLIGTLVPAGLAWARDRDVTSARVRRLDEATKRVGFWDQWLKLSTQLTEPGDSSVRERVRRELAMLCSMIESDSLVLHAAASRQQDQSTAYTVKIGTMPWWRKLLLLYKPERSLAYFPRFMYFLGILTIGIVLAAQTVSPDNKEGFYIILVLLAAWSFIFRYLSRWLEQPRGPVMAAHAAATPPPPPRAS